MKTFSKPYLLRLSLFLISLIAMTVEATAQIDTMYVYRTNGDTLSYAIEDVDSIVYAKQNTQNTEWKAVDLGLSSGVMWADRNVGANSAAEDGGYYAWGESVEKEFYDETTYAFYKDGKYEDIGMDIADKVYDVARMTWGEGWHMPSQSDFMELRDSCSWRWTSQNGRSGYSVTGPNGNSIFLPAAGYRYDSAPESVDKMGNYWTSEAGYVQHGTSIFFQITSSIRSFGRNPRYIGYSVRPVFTLASMYVCRTNGEMESYAVADVDSIVFGKPDRAEVADPWEAIDLGLSVKWANMNVGANSPEESGGFYAWGETEEKESYDESTYLYYKDGSYQDIGSNIAGTEYDVAHVKWGGDWRMPTLKECIELIEECTWTWSWQNGIEGYEITGPNGNSIFLPTAGVKEKAYLMSFWFGYYWSSTSDNPSSEEARSFGFYESGYGTKGYSKKRKLGMTVRAVCP